MSNYVLTVIFSSKYYHAITSKVYNLDTRNQAISILSNLQEDMGLSYNIRSSIACIGEENVQQNS